MLFGTPLPLPLSATLFIRTDMHNRVNSEFIRSPTPDSTSTEGPVALKIARLKAMLTAYPGNPMPIPTYLIMPTPIYLIMQCAKEDVQLLFPPPPMYTALLPCFQIELQISLTGGVTLVVNVQKHH